MILGFLFGGCEKGAQNTLNDVRLKVKYSSDYRPYILPIESRTFFRLKVDFAVVFWITMGLIELASNNSFWRGVDYYEKKKVTACKK